MIFFCRLRMNIVNKMKVFCQNIDRKDKSPWVLGYEKKCRKAVFEHRTLNVEHRIMKSLRSIDL